MRAMSAATLVDRNVRNAAAYEAHRSYVLAVLTRRCRWLEPDEREAALHDAWAILLEKERSGTLDVDAMRGPQVRAYLVQTALNRALDEGRRVARTRNEPLGDREDFADAAAAPEDVVDAGLEGARMREIVGELTARQQTIVKLRFFFDRTPTEIQRLLRITERAYRRDLERAMRIVSERYELVREGRFCESRASLVRAYVAGIAGPNRAREAREHIATCPACRRFAVDLREATDRFAGLLPLPLLGVSGPGVLARLGDLLDCGRDGAAHATAQAKHQVALLSTRVDPNATTVASGARPGAVAAAVAGCLALSGSAATYCAVVGIPEPLRGAVGVEAKAPHHAKAKPPKRAARKARPAAAPAAQPTTTTAARTAPPATTRTPATTTSTASTQTTKAKAKARARAAAKRERRKVTAQEFGFEGSGQRGSGTTASAASAGSGATSSGTTSSGSASGSTSGSAPQTHSEATAAEFGP